MTTFSANLGYLFTDRPLPEAIRAAKACGFDAVECHFPYDVPPAEVIAALEETGLPMISLNTRLGDRAAGEVGLCALPGREDDARDAITQAVTYAAEVGAGAIHVVAGVIEGEAAHRTFVENLRFATAQAASHGLTILLEPLNRFDTPGYFLWTTDQAIAIMDELAVPNIKLMFDFYHVERTEGDAIARLEHLLPRVGHIQFAGVPDRGQPETSTLDYAEVFRAVDRLGWTGPLGAEYRPDGKTEDSLGWMRDFR